MEVGSARAVVWRRSPILPGNWRLNYYVLNLPTIGTLVFQNLPFEIAN